MTLLRSMPLIASSASLNPIPGVSFRRALSIPLHAASADVFIIFLNGSMALQTRSKWKTRARFFVEMPLIVVSRPFVERPLIIVSRSFSSTVISPREKFFSVSSRKFLIVIHM